MNQQVSFSDSHIPKLHGSSGTRNDKAWNWLPGATIHDDCIRDDEYVASVAATAFAIHSLEEAESSKLQNMRESLKSSRTQTVRRREGNISRKPSYYDKTSMKRSFGQDSRTQESAIPVRRPSGISPPTMPTSPALRHQKQQGIPSQHKNVKTKPQTCDKAMIKMIHKQYEKIKSKILSQKFVKKVQAKSQRPIEMQSYKNKGTRAGLEDKRRKESEARKKANKNRKTKKVVLKCLCFNS